MKLSKPQQKVVDTLKNNQGSWALKSDLYHWNKIIDKEGKEIPKEWFWRPTFEVLVKVNILIKVSDKKYILNNSQ